MIYRPLNQEDGKKVAASALQICVLIVFVLFVPLFLERTWPLDNLFPGVRRGSHYDFVSAGLALLVSWLVCHQSGLTTREFAGKTPGKTRDVMMAALLGPTLFLFSITQGFFLELSRPLIDVELPLLYQGWSIVLIVAKDNMLGSLLPGHLYSGFGTVVLIPLIEECLFRGLLLRRLLARRAPWMAVLVSSLVFALSHIDSTPAYAFVGGLMLGMLYVKTASLGLVMIAHATANLTSFLSRYSSDMYAEPGFTITAKISAAIVVIVTAIIVIVVTKRVLKYFERRSV